MTDGGAADDPADGDRASSNSASSSASASSSDRASDSDDALLRAAARAPAQAPPAARGDLIGTTLGRYRVRALLGRGGMGVVYEADDVSLKRRVALKVLPADSLGSAERRARFLREARLAAAVTGPEIVPIHEVGEADGQIYLAMELVRGSTLRAAMTGPLPLPRALALARGVVRGLIRAHRAGVVHRDLKPENILVDGTAESAASTDLVVRLTDFGLARSAELGPGGAASAATVELETQEGRVLGTPGYMSPEQSKGEPVSDKTDMFSFGVLLFELLTGTRPFRGDSAVALAIAIDRDPAPRVHTRLAAVPPWLDDLVARCLAKSPADRPTAIECLAALDSAASPSPSTSPSPSRPAATPATPATPRSPTRALVIAGILAVTITAVAATLSYLRRRHVSTPASALLAPDAVLACPPLEVVGLPHGGWLGAAAGALACERGATLLGGGPIPRTLWPADLLDLPRRPSEDAPRDPYQADDARPRAIAAARARAQAWLDGSVHKLPRGIEVDLILRDARARELGRGHGSGPTPWQAVRGAMRELTQRGLFGPARALNPEVVLWSGLPDTTVEDALLWLDFNSALVSGVGVLEEYQRSIAIMGARLGPYRSFGDFVTLPFRPGATPPEPIALDHSSPARLAITATLRAATGDARGLEGVADELATLRASEKSAFGLLRLSAAEASVRATQGDLDGAQRLLLGRVLEEMPQDRSWWVAIRGALGRPELSPFVRLFQNWRPNEPGAWNPGNSNETERGRRLELVRRAVTLAPGDGGLSAALIVELLFAQQFAEARAVAASLAEGEPQLRELGESMLVLVDAAQARFGAALTRARSLLDKAQRITASNQEAIGNAVILSWLLGEPTTLADELSTRFVEPDPIRVDVGGMRPVVLICVYASAAHRAPCFDALERLVARQPEAFRLFVAGARAHAGGDFNAASRSWRTLAGQSFFHPILINDALQRAGELEAAAAADAQLVKMPGIFNGAAMAWVGAAKRAVERGDWAMARQVGQAVIAAWSGADVEVPAVAELRALLAKAPGPLP